MFRLLRYFSLTSALALLAVTLVLAYLYRQNAVTELIELAERQNVILARSLSNVIWPRFSNYVKGASGLDGDALRARPETRQIHRTLERLTVGLPVVKVKIYHSGGLTVYSSQADQMGADKKNDSGFLATARLGIPSSKLTYRETFKSFRGTIEDRNLVESYLPIRFEGGPVEGVFELYTDVTPLMARIENTTIKLVVGLMAAFAGLYGVLFLIVRRAQGILDRQYRQLEREIAEREQVEAKLTKQSTLLNSTFENMSGGISVLDADHRLVAYNKNYTELWDFPPGFIRSGMHCDEIARFRAERGDYGAGDVEEYVRQRAQAKQRCEILDNEITLPNGTVIALNATPMPGGGYVSTHTDITELKRAEAAVKRAHDEMEDKVKERTTQLTAVLDSAVVGIITIDALGMIRSFNPAAEKLFGYAAGEVIAKNISMLMPEPYAEEHDDYLARYLTSQKPKVLGRVRQITGRRSDGSTFPMELSAAKMVIDGEVSFVGNITDISERLAKDEQLYQSQKMESLGQLTGGVAHEFNNLLTSIGGFAEMAGRKADDSQRVRECVDEIVKATDQAAELTRQMLAFSRKQVLEPRLIPVGETIAGLKPMLKPLVGAEIALRMEIGEPETYAIVDPAQLTQAILNLAINGCHAMPEGGELVIGCGEVILDGRLRARFPQAQNGHYLGAYVIDTGAGIPDDVLPQIFDPFFTTKETGTGTGLGLSLVYGMAEQSGGFIDVETGIGKGSKFTIYLPLAEGDVPDHAAALSRGNGSRGTVLIVDDKAGVRDLARETLGELDYIVLTAENGSQAAELLGSRSPKVDVLITDIVMPGASGPEIARRLAAEHPKLKVIFLSADTALGTRSSTDLPNESKFLQKPFDRHELSRLVGELIEGVEVAPV
ncbi:MAG: PAS-domain containing protein [Proteobacteria bacterium]|nr:PAS-domain containing protein [Pseudomonadota bacterium]